MTTMDISIKTKEILGESIKFTKKTRIWCRLPYPNHPKGCPNYDKNPFCPPIAKFMVEILEIFSYFYLIFAEFNLKEHKERMKKLHPNWSERQSACVLYWQSSVKKSLKNYIFEVYMKNKTQSKYLLSCGSSFRLLEINQKEIYSMEAGGIDVLNTLKANSIQFETKPRDYVLLVNLLCSNEPLVVG